MRRHDEEGTRGDIELRPSKLVRTSSDAPTVLPMNDTIDELYATIFVGT